ncbi:hypothetical protein HZH68_009677 [Vespula germanica]|uniref:Uncharacterized protein n=1 Tax=Vespula germanica TaxID=30212 RepID=A0A834N461_VESGE|nr:hypothetical protein HZH68_009677 [Vespula germanica]
MEVLLPGQFPPSIPDLKSDGFLLVGLFVSTSENIASKEVAGADVPPLRASYDPENIESKEVAGLLVPPLSTSCVPDTKLNCREKFPDTTRFEILNRKTASNEVAGADVPPLRTSCDPVTNHDLREKFLLTQKLNF